MTTEVIRRFPGPVAERWCTRDPKSEAPRFQWVERSVGAGSGLLDARQTRVLAAHLPRTADADALVPSRSYGLTHWPRVRVQAVLFDQVFGGPLPGLPGLTTACAAAGGFLAALHHVELDDELRSLPVRGGAPWRQDNPALAERWDELCSELGHLLAPLTPAGPEPTSAGPDAGRPVLVHGRFSSAVMVPGVPMGIMAWAEAGVGDPLTDVAALLSELVEAAAILPARRAGLVDAATAFLTAYDADGGRPHRRLPRLVAQRILEHVCLRAAAVGARRDAEALLARVGATAPGFLAEVGVAGGEGSTS